MRKNVFGRKFKRDKNERKALLKSLMSSFVLVERIKTTEQKAKAIKGQIEKLVTLANKEKDARRNLFDKYLAPRAFEKLIRDVAPRFKQRPGGYTRIIRVGRRTTDSASLVMLEWVEGPIKKEKVEKAGKVSPEKRTSKTKVPKVSKVSKTKSKTTRNKKEKK